MNILVLVSSLQAGGAEKQAVMDANLLSGFHDVSLVAFRSGALKDQIGLGVKCRIIEKSGYLSAFLTLGKFIRNNRISIVHAHLYKGCVLSALISVFYPVSIVWHFHSHASIDLNRISARFLLNVLSRLHRVKKLLFVSCELQQDYLSRKFWFSDAKCAVFYNSTSQVTIKNEIHGSEKVVIGFVGRLVALKRADYFIYLASRLTFDCICPFEIEIIGDGPEKENLKHLVKQSKVDHLIHFRGFQKDTGKFYAHFDVFVNPSKEECLSIALIDAGVYGIPSVACNTGGNHEVLQDGKTGFLVTTKQEMVEKVKLLVENKQLRVTMGDNARIFCNGNFSISTRIANLNMLYASIMSKNDFNPPSSNTAC